MWLDTKGQIVSKRFFLAEDSSKKWTKTRRILVKTNSFVCFLEESLAWPFAFEINWPLSSYKIDHWVSWLWSWQMHAWCQAVFPSFLDHRECFLMWCGIDISFNQVSLTTTVWTKVYKIIRLAMFIKVLTLLGFQVETVAQNLLRG